MLLSREGISLNRSGQNGAILITVLVFVAIIGFATMNSMDSTILKLRMSINSQQQTFAMNDAEQVLDRAEDQVDAWQTAGSVPDWGTKGDAYLDSSSLGTTDIDVWTEPDIVPQNYSNGSYVVEYLGRQGHPGYSIVDTPEPDDVAHAAEYFRISVKSKGDAMATRQIQSIYSTLDMTQ